MSELPINQIICGDCLEVMRDWPDGCVDLVVTSPPYDNMRKYNGYSFEFENTAKELVRVVKQGGVVVWVVGDATVDGSETGTSFRQALYFKRLGFNIHDTMIYTKGGQGATGSNRAYWQDFEYMFVLSKGRPKAINLIADRKNATRPRTAYEAAGHRHTSGETKKSRIINRHEYGKRLNVWQYHEAGTRVNHPAVFPVALATDHIRSWSVDGDLAADPFCGSGTTCVAAKKLGRRYIGIDISSEYCQIARDRLRAVETGVPVQEAQKGQKALFE